MVMLIWDWFSVNFLAGSEAPFSPLDNDGQSPRIKRPLNLSRHALRLLRTRGSRKASAGLCYLRLKEPFTGVVLTRYGPAPR